MIALIDYGAGNLRSVANAIIKLGYQPNITRSPADVLNASAVILPGVGAAADAMANLQKIDMIDAIKRVVKDGKPFLGVCIGLQILLESTEEGNAKCLGIIPGKVQKLPAGVKIPHMGWNQVAQQRKHPVFEGLPDKANFYFVHSYYANPDDNKVVAGVTEYNIPFCSVIIKDNLVATQFHPEKSGEPGLKFYDNFLKMALGKAAK